MKVFSRALVLSPSPTHPQNFGNRNRIFNVCSALKTRGVRVDLLHYPSEWNWRTNIPAPDMRQMQEAWDDVFTVPPSRPLHTFSLREDHLIDEWWDDSIGVYLKWLFDVRKYSHFIVNYTWLSRAFEFAPDEVLKILDTHDRFSGRRQLLASLGVSAEFFHTTQDQEKIALDRADLVVAIKHEEHEFFSTLTKKKVITLIHSEPEKYLLSTFKSDVSRDRLRLGFLGARNSINKENFRVFLDAIVPAIRNTMASVEIVLAGGICGDFETYAADELTLLGYVERVEDFYESVDAVVAPIVSSTGLKIKVGEALSHGKPLLATKHAFEGYEPSHRLQQIENISEFVKECIALSFDPAELAIMALHSRMSHRRSVLNFDSAVDELVNTRKSDRPSILVIVDKHIGYYRSAAGNRQIDLIRYLSYISDVYVYLVGEISAEDIRAFENFHLPAVKIVTTTQNSAGAEASVLRASLSVILKELVISTIWVSAMAEEEVRAIEEFTGLIIVDTVLYKSGSLLRPMLNNGNQIYFVFYPGSDPIMQCWPQITQERRLSLPLWKNVQAELNDSWRGGWNGPGIIVLIDQSSTAALVAALARQELDGLFYHATVVWDDTDASAKAPQGVKSLCLSHILADLRRIGERPVYCVDMCVDNGGMNFVREMMLRFDTPVIPLARLVHFGREFLSNQAPNFDPASKNRIDSEFERVCLPTRSLYDNDACWCQVWYIVQHAQQTRVRLSSRASN